MDRQETPKFNKPELLAPAANTAAALCAFDCGADAVYAGLHKFNARERSDNFSQEELAKLINYAHKINKKIYITFNTLIKESEIIEVASSLAELNQMRPDAVIVQDLGILRMIREYFPALKIHASTQMGIHNSAGVNFAESIGVKRVILERQIPLDELKLIKANSRIELEVFIHGALCCSLSGSCLFSSWLGGCSGNRGKCKQPCRRRFGSGGNASGFYLSPGDLCAYELIAEYKRLGIASLKIEGRLKKSDYVRQCVSAYRTLLDASEAEYPAAVEEASEIFHSIPGRRKIKTLRSKDGFRDLIHKDEMGIPGILCGRVAEVSKFGFTAAVSGRIHLGDRIRIQQDDETEGPSVLVTGLKVNGTDVKKARKGENCFIKASKNIGKGSLIYKIGESWDEMSSRIAALPMPGKKLDLDIAVSRTLTSVRISNCSNEIFWQETTNFEEAKNASKLESAVKDEFGGMLGENFETGHLKLSITENPFVPASILRKLKKSFVSHLNANLKADELSDSQAKTFERFIEDYSKMNAAAMDEKPESIFFGIGNRSPDELNSIGSGRIVRRAESIYGEYGNADEIVLPHFCSEHDLKELKVLIKKASEKSAPLFRIRSLFELELLKDIKYAELKVSFPLPVSNSLAAAELASHGVTSVQGWAELEKEELEKLFAKSPIKTEIYRYGRLPILATRAKIDAASVRDSYNCEYRIITDRKSGVSYLLSDSVFDTGEAFKSASWFYDLSNAGPGEKTSSFNLFKRWE